MIAFLDGKVCEKTAGQLVISCGGVGFQLSCSMNTLQAAPAVGESMHCLTVFSVREDAMELYGFATAEERALFLRLIGVSGVGPKMALALLGAMPLRDLNIAILMEDITAISRAPGIGKKTAQRIALELKDKVSAPDAAAGGSAGVPAAAAAVDGLTEAMEGLIALGYSAVEARTALSRVKDKSAKPDELIGLALREMVNM